MKNIIIDSDFGVDDTICIEYLIAQHLKGNINIIGFSSVCGNIKAFNSYKTGKLLLKNIFKTDIPIFYSKISSKNDIRCSYFYGEDGHYMYMKDNMDYKNIEPSETSSTDFLLKSLNNVDNVTIIAIGPLTNLSNCELRCPGILNKAKQILIMGGAINVPGNITSESEYNFYIDPKSIKRVLKYKNTILFPLDITLKIKYPIKKLNNKFSKCINNKFYKNIIENMYKQELEHNEIHLNSDYVIIHDLVTAIYLFNPNIFTIKKYKVDIDDNDGNIFIDNAFELNVANNVSNSMLLVEYFNKMN